ncbi:MAG: transcriptional repressor LexA [Planctomycetota bacterium]
MPSELTPRQREVLDFIRRFLDERGFPPSQAEIAAALGLRSTNAVAQHLRLLEKKGALRTTAGAARGLRLARPVETGLPLIGEVAAGRPILAEENVERRIELPPSLFRPRADYLLRVRGDSMIEVGIRPGDLVAVRRCDRLEEGEIAVVRIDDEVTLKRWTTHDNKVILRPENRALRPLVLDPRRDAIAVEGTVVGLLRLQIDPDPVR